MEDIKRKIAKGELKSVNNTKGKAPFWIKFDIITNLQNEPTGFVQCVLCKAVLSYDSKKTGSSHLRRHLQRSCGGGGPGGGDRQQSVSDFLSFAKPPPERMKSEVANKCVNFCCMDIRPFETVAGVGFRELAQELINVGATHGRISANEVLPNPTTISRRCKIMASEMRGGTVEEIKEVMSLINIGMTTDMWTDDFRKMSYMAITCHYVTPTFELKRKLLTTTCFPNHAKTGDNIRKELKQQLVTVLGFDASVLNNVVWVTDQDANVLAALRPYRHLACQDHLYNTVLRHALNTDELAEVVPEVAETLLAVKALVRYLKQSGLASQLPTTVKQMAETRYNTVFLTLELIQSVHAELQELLQSRDESARLRNVSPDVLAFLVEFLRPFNDAQKELEGDKHHPTLHLAVLWANKLKSHCQPDVADTPSQAVIRQRHLDWLTKTIEIQPLHKIAIFLWPKFNQLRMFNPAERTDIQQHVRILINRFREGEVAAARRQEQATGQSDGSSAAAAGPAPKRRALEEFEKAWENVSEESEDADEVQFYLSLNPTMEADGRDLLSWWKQHETTLPLLARLARMVFSVPASRSSSERAFSAAGRAIGERRTGLAPETVDAILFLHDAK
uniref:BED-type domain-containing protein n=1 Tax=Nothobranchius pienaari TaxID=704102 RepID=A0A1A8LDQ2_9TELE